jgi:hypothetical protein
MGIVAGCDQIADPEIVRFIFLRARIAEREQLRRLPRDPGQLLGSGDQPDRKHAEFPKQGALLLPLAMITDDVAELMREHRGELRLTVDDAHQPARDVDVAAGYRKGVHHVGVDEREGALPFQIGSLRQLLAEPEKVGRLRPLISPAELRQKLRMLLGSEPPLALVDVGRSRRGIAASAGGEEQDWSKEEAAHVIPAATRGRHAWLR